MAAAYSTGISSSPTNLLQTVVSFLVTQGWTQDSSVSDGTGWRAHLHKSGLYVNLRAAMNEKIYPYGVSDYHDSYAGYGIGVYLGDGYSGGSSWIEQSGGPIRQTDSSVIGVGANLPSGSVAAYHLFDDGSDNIIVVVEKTPGVFSHLGFGPDMSAAGQPEDFPYCFGSSNCYRNVTPIADLGSAERHGVNVTALAPMSPADTDYRSDAGGNSSNHTNALVRVDATTFSGRWVGNGAGTYAGHGNTGRVMRCSLVDDPDIQTMFDHADYISYRYLRDRVHQTAYAGGVLLPLHCFVLTDPDARYAPIGYPPSLFWCDIVGHGYGSGDTYSVGGVDYMVFPGFAVMKGA